MNLFNNGYLFAMCPALNNPLTIADELGLIRITIDPDCISDDAHCELMAMFAEDYCLPHYGAWENSVDYAVCFIEDGEEWKPILEASTADGKSVYLDIDAEPEELANLYLPLFDPGKFEEQDCLDGFAGVMEGLCFSNYKEMLEQTASAMVCLLDVVATRNNPLLALLPGFDHVLTLSINRRIPMVANLFIDFCTAVKLAAKV